LLIRERKAKQLRSQSHGRLLQYNEASDENYMTKL